MTLKVIILILVTLSGVKAQQTDTGPEGDCGFSKLRPRQIAHYVERGAVSKVTPQYPLASKAKRVSGTVRVRVLINSQGLVEKTCPEFVIRQPRPDRNLVIAAEAAALQWTFDPNFGVQPVGGVQFEYAQGVLVFKFAPHGAK